MTNIQEYLTDLVIQAGFTPDQHDEIIAELEPILLSRIIVKLMLKISTGEREKAEHYLGEGKSELFWKLCQENIPNYEGYFVSILEEFEQEYLENFK